MSKNKEWNYLVRTWMKDLLVKASNVDIYFYNIFYCMQEGEMPENREIRALPYANKREQKKRSELYEIGWCRVSNNVKTWDYISEDNEKPLIVANKRLRYEIINSIVEYCKSVCVNDAFCSVNIPVDQYGDIPIVVTRKWETEWSADARIELKRNIYHLNNGHVLDVCGCGILIAILEELAINEEITPRERDYYIYYIFNCLNNGKKIELEYLWTHGEVWSQEHCESYERFVLTYLLESNTYRSTGQLWNDISVTSLKNPRPDYDEKDSLVNIPCLYKCPNNDLDKEVKIRLGESKNTLADFSDLSFFMNNKELCSYFKDQGYQVKINIKGPEMTESMKQIYKQAISDAVGECIVTKKLNIPLVKPTDASVWPLSQYELGADSYVVFKNWSDCNRLEEEQIQDKIFERMKVVRAKEVFWVNMTGVCMAQEVTREGMKLHIITGVLNGDSEFQLDVLKHKMAI